MEAQGQTSETGWQEGRIGAAGFILVFIATQEERSPHVSDEVQR